MCSNTPRHVIEGFEEDFCAVVDEFVSFCPELRLIKFFEFWNNERLDYLFANRYDSREVVEAITFMNESLVDKLTNTSNPDSTRIVALYFIFCLHSKQPQNIKRKVRLTCQDAVTIQNLVKSQQNVRYKNCRFVWNQMRAKQTILLVEERIIYGPSMLKKHHPTLNAIDEASDDRNSTDDTTEFFNNHITPHLNEVENMLTTYQELRNKLKLDEVSDPTVEINSTGTLTQFISQAKDMLTNFRQSSA